MLMANRPPSRHSFKPAKRFCARLSFEEVSLHELYILGRLELKPLPTPASRHDLAEDAMNISSSFLRDTQHISTHDRRLVPGSTALQDRLQSSERCTRFCGPPAQRLHRHKRLKVSAQTVATVPQSQLPQSLRNNLVRLQADGPSGTCNVYLLGVSHVSQVHTLQLHTLKLSLLFARSPRPETTPNNSTKQYFQFFVNEHSVQILHVVGQWWLMIHSSFTAYACIHQWQLHHSVSRFEISMTVVLVHLNAQV